MKQTFLTFSGKKFIGAAFLSASVLLTSLQANATKATAYNQPSSESKSDIQFSGSSADGIFLKLHVNNETGSEFRLTIKGDNEEVLYTKSFSEKDLNQQFKFPKDEYYINHYYFIITSANKDLETKYVVNATSKMVDDIAISKL